MLVWPNTNFAVLVPFKVPVKLPPVVGIKSPSVVATHEVLAELYDNICP